VESPAALLVAALLAAGCGLIEQTGTGSDGDTSPFTPPLRVLEVEPASRTLSTSPRIELRFNSHLDDDSFSTFDAGTLSSGGRSWRGWADYVVSEKTLVWESRTAVPPGLDARLSLGDQIRSVGGKSVENRRNVAEFRVDDRPPRSPEPGEAPRWSDVESIFEQKCNECHADPSWGLVRLEPERLVGVESDQVDRLLVKPFDPADSYLLQKLLWDYPDLRKSPQPPRWSGARELPLRQKRTVERWIEIGAPVDRR